MISLLDSDAFKKEYSRYKEDIKNITVETVRRSAELALNKLVSEIKFLDNQHHELFTTHKVPMRLDESKKKITTLRKDLNRLINDSRSINS